MGWTEIPPRASSTKSIPQTSGRISPVVVDNFWKRNLSLTPHKELSRTNSSQMSLRSRKQVVDEHSLHHHKTK